MEISTQDEFEAPIIQEPINNSGIIQEPPASLKPLAMSTDKQLSVEEIAEAEDLSKRLNVPSIMVGADLPKYRKMAQVNDLDAASNDAPAVKTWMGQSRQNFMAGNTDAKNLIEFEKIMMAGPEGLGGRALQPEFDEKKTVTGKEGFAYSKLQEVKNEPTGPSVGIDFNPETGEFRERNKWEVAADEANKVKRDRDAQIELRQTRAESGDWIWQDTWYGRAKRQLMAGRVDVESALWGSLKGLDELLASVTKGTVIGDFFRSGADYAASKFSEAKMDAETVGFEKEAGGTMQQISDAVLRNFPQMLATMVATWLGAGLAGATGIAKKIAATLMGKRQAAYAARAGAATMAAQIYGETYGSAREAGADPLQANLGAIPNAIVQGSLENIGLGKIFQAWKSTGALSYIKNSLVASFAEGVTEWIQQFPDDFFHMVSMIGSDDGAKDFSSGVTDFVRNLPDTVEGANMGAAVGAIYGLLFSLPGLRGQARRERAMLNDKAFFEAINDSAKASSLREKLPSVYQEIVDQVTQDGPVQNVYVSAEDLVNAAVSLDQDSYEFAEGLGISREQLDNAARVGADVEVPIALYQSKVAGTEAGLHLSGRVRTSADGMTLEEMTAARTRTIGAINQALQEIAADSKMSAELDEALSGVRDSLIASGQSESAADNQLQLFKALAVTGARRWTAITGEEMTPVQYVNDHLGLSVRVEDQQRQNVAPTPSREQVQAALDEARKNFEDLVRARRNANGEYVRSDVTPDNIDDDYRELLYDGRMVDGELGQHYDAHGISKGGITDQFNKLLDILANGFDTSRDLHTAPFEITDEMRAALGAALGTSGGTAYRNGLATFVSRYDGKVADGIGVVFIADRAASIIEPLRKAFPNIRFEKMSDNARVLQEMAQEQQGTQSLQQMLGERGAAAMDQAEEATTRMDNLAVARDMEAAGKDAKAVKLATGWERGADGKWRYEVPDGKWKQGGLAGMHTERHLIVGEETSWMEGRLGDVFDAPELYEAYPELRGMTLIFAETDRGTQGYYDGTTIILSKDLLKGENPEWARQYKELLESEEYRRYNEELDATDNIADPEEAEQVYNEIEKRFNESDLGKRYNALLNSRQRMSRMLTQEGRSVLLHEIQHAIQRKEGFATGGNETVGDVLRAKARAYAWKLELEKAEEDHPDLAGTLDLMNTLVKEYDEMGMREDLPSAATRTTGFNLYVRGYDREGYEDAYRLWEKIGLDDNAEDYRTYKLISGEVESRNVQRRMNMTEEERRASLASETEDVAREDQIFIGQTETAESREHRSPITDPAEFAEDVRTSAEKGPRYDTVGNVVFDGESYEIRLSDIQVRHNFNDHPAFSEWGKVVDVIQQGESYGVSSLPSSKHMGTTFVLAEGDKAYVVLATVMKTADGNIVRIHSALTTTTAHAQEMKMRKRRTASTRRSSGGSPDTPKPLRDVATVLGEGSSHEVNITDTRGAVNHSENATQGSIALDLSEVSDKDRLFLEAPQRSSSLMQEGAEAEARTLFQRAFHGSPHRFEQFMLEHIGTGEGAQAHGWGLYFAKTKRTAERYRKGLQKSKGSGQLYEVEIPDNDVLLDEQMYFPDQHKNVKKLIADAIHSLSERQQTIFFQKILGRKLDDSDAYNKVAVQLDEITLLQDAFLTDGSESKFARNFRRENLKNHGYTDEQIDAFWSNRDKAIEEAKKYSPERIRLQDELDAIKKRDDERRARLISEAKNDLDKGLSRTSGDQLYDAIAWAISDGGYPVFRDASVWLNEHGIKGITYNGASDGRCFVVFEDKAVQMIDTFYQMQQDHAPTGPRGQIEFAGDNEAVITLFRGAADLSTFAHEAGHLFFRDLERMAMTSNAPQEIIDDYLTLKRWTAENTESYYNAHMRRNYGGRSFAELSEEERNRVDYIAEQELLAEGWLTYLKEGKAPSVELRSVFSRFRDWLSTIYRALSGNGFQPINDEVRGVFDRMLASDQEVAEAEAMHEATAEERAAIDAVGEEMLTEAEMRRFRAAQQRATAQAREKTLADRLKAFFKATGEDKQMTAMAKKEVEAMPIFAAMEIAIRNGGITYESVEELYGEDTAKALNKKRPSLVRKNGGVDISQVAASQDMSADDLVSGILNGPTKGEAVKAAKQRMMQEREEQIKAELSAGNDGLLPGEEGYYSDDRLATLLMEATALARKAGRKVRTAGNAEANRSWARQMLAGMTMSETNIGRLSTAEAKQARLVGKLLAEGKIEEAADAKRKQAILHAMVLESMDFHKRLDAFTRKMRRWAKRDTKTDEDAWKYKEQLMALAQRYRIGGRDRFAPAKPQERSRLRDFLQHTEEDSVFDVPPFSDWILDEQVPERNGRLQLTVEQYDEIMDLGKYLAEQMDPGEAEVITEGLEGTVQELVDKAKTTLENSGNVFTYKEEKTLGRKSQDLWKSLFAGLDNTQYVFMAADRYEEIGK
ncbi:MAG: hypothetical protein J6I40_02460, partial [Mailhella sp.]|nr:hypothetical protein [Mailhella sp.]